MKIRKAQLETLIRMSLNYWSYNFWRDGRTDEELMAAMCRSRTLFANKTWGDGFGYVLGNVVDAINGAKQKKVTIEDVIRIFGMLGYEVTE